MSPQDDLPLSLEALRCDPSFEDSTSRLSWDRVDSVLSTRDDSPLDSELKDLVNQLISPNDIFQWSPEVPVDHQEEWLRDEDTQQVNNIMDLQAEGDKIPGLEGGRLEREETAKRRGRPRLFPAEVRKERKKLQTAICAQKRRANRKVKRQQLEKDFKTKKTNCEIILKRVQQLHPDAKVIPFKKLKYPPDCESIRRKERPHKMKNSRTPEERALQHLRNKQKNNEAKKRSRMREKIDIHNITGEIAHLEAEIKRLSKHLPTTFLVEGREVAMHCLLEGGQIRSGLQSSSLCS